MTTRPENHPIERVLDALGYSGPRNHGTIMCHCPAHEDRRESLAVTEGDDGRVLIHCHAGCLPESVVRAVDLSMSDLFPAKARRTKKPKRSLGPIIATYDYRDEQGALLFQVTRHEPKDFRQRRPDGRGGWIWDVKGVGLVLYRTPELTAAPANDWLFVVEGEKDVDNLRAVGVTATCNPVGAGKWKPVYSEQLRGRRVAILPDNDPPGRVHAEKVVRELRGVVAELRVVELPGLPDKGDVSDWLNAGGTAEQLVEIVEATPNYSPEPCARADRANSHHKRRDADGSDDTVDLSQADAASERKNQADILFELALERAELFIAPDGIAYARFEVNGHLETHRLKTEGFTGWLKAVYRAIFKRLPRTQAVQDAGAALDWEARNHKRTVYTRVGQHAGKIYIDLGRENWDAIEVDEEGWRVIARPPVAFRRSRSMAPLPLPAEGGDIVLLKRFVNVDDADWPLLAAVALASVYPQGPFIILVLVGEHGTAKSTTMRVLKRLIDPQKPELRGAPTDIRDLMIAASNSWILAFDNVSGLSGHVSDALCRIATGGGYTKRANYTDDDEVLIDVQRPIMINGIGDIVTRPDMMDRAILIAPPVIPDTKRKPESEFWRDFQKDHPLLLGALLDVLATALRNLPHVTLPKSPRMADFARVAVAGEQAYGVESYRFLTEYERNRSESNAVVVETSVMGEYLRKLVPISGSWEGTATHLLSALNELASEAERRAEGWPKAPNRLRPMLQRLAPSLRQIGVDVLFPRRSDKHGSRRIILTRLNDAMDGGEE